MKKVGLAIVAAVAILLGIQQVPGESDKTAFEIITSGDDRVLLVAVAYEPSGDRAVESIVCDAESLTKNGTSGCIEQALQIELWSLIAPPLGPVTVTITMTEDCAAEAVALCLTDTDQETPLAGQTIDVGTGLSGITVQKDGGAATVIITFSTPKSETLSTPSGFFETGTWVGDSDIRAACFLDDDASEASADLDYSGTVDIASFILGVNLAP